MNPIRTERLILRAFQKSDYDDLYEFLSQLRENVWFYKDENGAPIWKDTYIYALLASEAPAAQRSSDSEE